MKLPVHILLLGFALLSADVGKGEISAPETPWCYTLAYGGGDYWSMRLPVMIRNHSGKPLSGMQLQLTVAEKDGTGDLIGIPVCEIRVADEKGVEYMFELQDENLQRKR
jgi:hypothetical protein